MFYYVISLDVSTDTFFRYSSYCFYSDGGQVDWNSFCLDRVRLGIQLFYHYHWGLVQMHQIPLNLDICWEYQDTGNYLLSYYWLEFWVIIHMIEGKYAHIAIRLDVHYWLQNNYNDVVPGFSSYRRKDLHLMLISLSVSSFWNNKCHIICKASTTTAVHALAGGFRTFSTLASCLRQCWYSHILLSIR